MKCYNYPITMNQKNLSKFISFLLEKSAVFSPQEENNEIIIKELATGKEKIIFDKPPFYSWKKFFVPEQECLLNFTGETQSFPSPKNGEIVLFGLNILDLKAVLLYDSVFSNDPYYQIRRKNALIIAHNIIPPPENNLSLKQYNKEDLKNLPFDIFIEITPPKYPPEGDHPPGGKMLNAKYTFIAGSEKGKNILDDFGYKSYGYIKFETPLKETGKNQKLNVWRENLKNKHNQKIWDKLGKICLECGKCTIVCPTCFCFRIDDQAELAENTGCRNRCWDSCFYSEFSEVAGGKKFLENTAQRIHFWYFHKFARIPEELGITGCIGCHRCHKVCPVEIDIKKVLGEIEQS